MRAEWVVAHVERPGAKASEADRDRVVRTLRLAEELGAETGALAGHDLAGELVRRNVSKIVLGKTRQPRWRETLFGSVVNELVRKSGDIDVHVITGEGCVRHRRPRPSNRAPGVPPGAEVRVFDRFYRGRRGTAEGGVGLELTVGKGIVEAHGGRIDAVNRPGGGVVFRFTVPLGRSLQSSRPRTGEMAQPEEPARATEPAAIVPVVVLIEDEPQIRRFLRPTLAHEGYRGIEAATGEDGLLQAAPRQPDLLILDLGLPDVDGVEVLRRLREWTAVPVIILSALGQERDKVTALDAGADDYVAKPFAVGELLARMRAALRRATRVAAGTEESIFRAGDLLVDLARRRVSVAGTDVRLTPTEYRWRTLVRHAGKVLTHRQLLQEVWGLRTLTRRNTCGST